MMVRWSAGPSMVRWSAERRKIRKLNRKCAAPTAEPQNLLFFELQLALGFIFLKELAQLRRGLQKTVPLLVVKRDGKAAEPVNADPAFFSNSKFECAGAPSGALLLQFRDTRFEFLIRWLGHVASPARWNRNGIIHCVFDLRPRIFIRTSGLRLRCSREQGKP